MALILILGIVGIIVVISGIVAAASMVQPAPEITVTDDDRLERIAQLELNNTMAREKYLQAINENNLTKKIELMQEANMYENGTWTETCRLYPELNC